MRGLPMWCLLLGWGVMAGACAQQAPRTQAESTLLVPSAALVSGKKARLNPYEVLPASDGEWFVERGEKVAYGAYAEGEFASFTIYTYDAQAISNLDGSVGYRYRWVVQQGISTPPAP